MSALRFILFFYAITTIFVAGGLFFKDGNKSNRALTLFLLLLGLEMLDFLYATSILKSLFPEFFGVYYFSAGFFYGPALWFHFLFLTKPERSFQSKDFLHLLFGVLIFIYLSDILTLPGEERIIYISKHFYDRIMPINYIRAAHILIYGFACIWLVRQHFYEMALKRRFYSIAICSIYFLVAVLISWLTAFADNWRQFVIHYFLSFSSVLLIGVLLYWDPNFLKAITKKYLHSSLNRDEMNRIHSKLIRSFGEDRIFIRNNLKLRDLSTYIDENPGYISQTLSELLDQNFNDFVNKYRVEYAKTLLSSSDYAHYKIEAIAKESGFNNKVTFYKSFTKFAKVSPASFRKGI